MKDTTGENQDYSTAHALHELDQVIAKLQTVVRLENEQHLRDILSKMPPGFVNLDKLMIPDEVLQSRKVPMKISDVRVDTIGADVESGAAVKESVSLAEVHPNSTEESEVVPISNPPQTITTESLTPSVNLPSPEEKTSSVTTSTNDTQSDTTDEPLLDDAIPLGKLGKATLSPSVESIILSMRQDLLSVQKQMYTQIMNSLFEYKIDLYKNLLRSGIDVSCSGESTKKANHKNFMFIRHLQQMVAKSSEANFESWYKFYSYTVLPKMRDIVGKLDSIPMQGVKEEWNARVEEGHGEEKSMKVDGKGETDDFFVRAALPNSELDPQAIHLPEEGFDWTNLDKRLRESINLKQHDKHRSRDGETKSGGDRKSGEVKGAKRKNYVELQENVETHKSESGDRKNSHVRKDASPEHKRKENEHQGQHAVKKLNKNERRKDRRESIKTEDRKHQESTDEFVRDGKKQEYKVDIRKRQVKADDQRPHKRQDRKDDGRKIETKEGGRKYERKREDEFDDKYEHGKRRNDKKCDEKWCKGNGKREGNERRAKRKSFLSHMTKYVKNAASGLWETVEKGIKKVKHYGEAVKSSMKSSKSEESPSAKSGEYEEWRKEFVKELKDLIRVVGGNPTINSLYEMPKSVTQFFGEGLSKMMDTDEDIEEDENVEGPEGVMRDQSSFPSDEGYSSDVPVNQDDGRPTWYERVARHREESRGTYPSRSDPSWFLGLGRHRSFLRRRGIHLDDDGSWFISSAKHRAKMRQRHLDPHSQPFFQASSKR